MSNETKRDVFDELLKMFRNSMALTHEEPVILDNDGYDVFGKIEKSYDAALPDDLPVIPELIGKYLKMRKQDHGNLVQALDEGTSFVLDGTQWESVQDWFWDAKDSFDTFARAWVLGVWRVEETGEIVKLEEEK
ncbi:hypothetical protein HLG73_06075 [Lacticaseibacillus paracasei]|uniref:hypothetical protein n=1 Tax=Lacticaseibacillus paracasei TaxID=1597 RepID=UPI00235953E7|nr:hypothetical protein [Lacticaseibacillus paracasei]WCZ18926.1 hypothetical protein HLG73_06075 [Lacticaseibacillus paracasei]